MKTYFILLTLISCLAANNVFSQTGEGEEIEVNIKKKKPVILWKSLLNNDTVINKLTYRIQADINCEDDIKSAELFVNGNIQRGFEPITSKNKNQYKIDQTIVLSEGPNKIYISAKTEKATVDSETKKIVARKSKEKPLITWSNPQSEQSLVANSQINIEACIKSDMPVKETQIYLNGSLYSKNPKIANSNGDCAAFISEKVSLNEGKNSIYITASNENGITTSKTIELNFYRQMTKQKRVALIIGNSEYENAGVLKNPKNDANSMASVLKNLNFEVELVSDADYKKMGMAIDRFGELIKKADIALFYYAGHGVQVNGSNYLIPVDANLADENQVKFHCYDANQVLAYMESGESKVNIIIMDACRDNPFERGWKRSVKGTGLASMDAPVGSIIAYATQPGNTAADGNGKNGLYTSALLEYFANPNLSLNEIFMKVRVKVLKDSGKKQQPWESSSLTENIYLLK